MKATGYRNKWGRLISSSERREWWWWFLLYALIYCLYYTSHQNIFILTKIRVTVFKYQEKYRTVLDWTFVIKWYEVKAFYPYVLDRSLLHRSWLCYVIWFVPIMGKIEGALHCDLKSWLDRKYIDWKSR